MTEESKRFILRTGDETRPVVEDWSLKEKSIFKEQYNESLSLVDSIIEHNEEAKKDKLNICNNNIVAFIGQRGTGKTSCMMSVAKMLSEYKSNCKECEPKLNYISNGKLFFLNVIDPSFFDTKHNILELIIGNMYSTYSNEIKRNSGEGRVNTQHIKDLLESFQTVKHDLVYLNQDASTTLDPMYDELEQLRNLSAGANLVNSIHSLVTNFLYFMKHHVAGPVA